MRNARVVTVVLGLLVSSAGLGLAGGFPTTDRPDAVGDQVVFYYDARENFTTFLNLRNSDTGALDVQILLYDQEFNAPRIETRTVPGNGLLIIDVAQLDGFPAQAGVAIATAIDGGGDTVVTKALSGNFTVANLLTNSAWGAPAPARKAIEFTKGGTTIPLMGEVIDGSHIALIPIHPSRLDLATYYNPNTLAPVVLGGNQLIFLAFEDDSGSPYRAQLSSATWRANTFRNTGEPIGPTDFSVNGVAISDLASVAGSSVNGAPGSILFIAVGGNSLSTRLVFFAEALGTFGTGYLLPPA